MNFFKSKRKFLYLSLIPFLVTAFFSEGFYHPDEHYVILEFLQTKISNYTRPEIFQWDYHQKIRPWFQSFLYYGLYLIQPSKNPFWVATLMRLFNALLGWFALKELLKHYFRDHDYEKKLLMASLIWFVPFIFARTSGESLSASLFILGSVHFLKGRPLKSGLFWGLSFLARYQMGVAIMAGSLWHLFKKRNFKFFFINAIGILIIMGLGPVIDHWGYGEWTYSPYNYLYTNLVENRSAEFGVSPFWYYLTKPLSKAGLPIGIYLLVTCLLFFIREIRSFWTVVIIFFVMVHSAIPHKEVRFLSLIYVLMPFLLFMTWRQVIGLKNKYLLAFLGIINFLIMMKSSFTPAEGMLKLYEHVYHSEQKFYYTKADKQGNYFQFTMPFYETVKTETMPYKNLNELRGKKNVYLVTTKYKEYLDFKKLNCDKEFLSYPEVVFEKFNFFGWVERSAIMAIWKCSF